MSYDRAQLLFYSEVVAQRFPDPPRGFQPFKCVSSSDLQEEQWQVVIPVVVRTEKALGSQKIGIVEAGKLVTQWGPIVTLRGGQDEGVTRIHIVSPVRGWVTLSAAAQQGPTFLQKPFHPTAWVALVNFDLRENAELDSRHVSTLGEGTVVRQSGPFRVISDMVMMPVKHPHNVPTVNNDIAQNTQHGWVTLDTRLVGGNADEKGDKFFTIFDVDNHEIGSPKNNALSSERNASLPQECVDRPKNVKDENAGRCIGSMRVEEDVRPVKMKSNMQVDSGIAKTLQHARSNGQDESEKNRHYLNKITQSTSRNALKNKIGSWKISSEEQQECRMYDEKEWNARNDVWKLTNTNDWWKTDANKWETSKTQQGTKTTTGAQCKEAHQKTTLHDIHSRGDASLSAEGGDAVELAKSVAPVSAQDVFSKDTFATGLTGEKWGSNNKTTWEQQKNLHDQNGVKTDAAMEAASIKRGGWAENNGWSSKWEGNNRSTFKANEWSVVTNDDVVSEANKFEYSSYSKDKDWASKWKHSAAELDSKEHLQESNTPKINSYTEKAAKSEHSGHDNKISNNDQTQGQQNSLFDPKAAFQTENSNEAEREKIYKAPFDYTEWSSLKERSATEARANKQGQKKTDEPDIATTSGHDNETQWGKRDDRREWSAKKEYHMESHRDDWYGSYNRPSKAEETLAIVAAGRIDDVRNRGESYSNMVVADESRMHSNACILKKAEQPMAKAKIRQTDLLCAYNAHQPAIPQAVHWSSNTSLRERLDNAPNALSCQQAEEETHRKNSSNAPKQKPPNDSQNMLGAQQTEATIRSAQNACTMEQEQSEDAHNKQKDRVPLAELWCAQNEWTWQQNLRVGAQNKQNEWEPASNVKDQAITVAQHDQCDWHIETKSTKSKSSYYTQHSPQKKSPINGADKQHSDHAAGISLSFLNVGHSTAEVHSRRFSNHGSQPFQATGDNKACEPQLLQQNIGGMAETWAATIQTQNALSKAFVTPWNASGVPKNNSGNILCTASTAQQSHGEQSTIASQAGYTIVPETKKNSSEETDMYVVRPPRRESADSLATATWSFDASEWNTAPFDRVARDAKKQ